MRLIDIIDDLRAIAKENKLRLNRWSEFKRAYNLYLKSCS